MQGIRHGFRRVPSTDRSRGLQPLLHLRHSGREVVHLRDVGAVLRGVVPVLHQGQAHVARLLGHDVLHDAADVVRGGVDVGGHAARGVHGEGQVQEAAVVTGQRRLRHVGHGVTHDQLLLQFG